jgi:polysaccharide export outer membrane protein
MCRKILPVIWVLVFVMILLPIGDRLCLAETDNPTYSASYEYIVTSGDVLEIAVWGHQDLSGTVTVNEHGNISLAGLPEEIHVLGMTVSEVQASLTEMLAYYLRNPIISVTLRETRVIRITVIGSVRSPGVYSFRSKPTLIGALASAGGYISEADLTRVRITRMGTMASTSNTRSESIIVDIDKVLTGEKEIPSEYGFVLNDGDIVYVPERARTVSVLGEVQRPGVYTVDTKGEGTSVFDIIAAAGGPGINADTGCVRVTRSKDQTACTTEIDLDTYDGTFRLVPGDVIYVPRAIRVQVLGQVKSPGSYQLKAESTLIPCHSSGRWHAGFSGHRLYFTA